MAQNSLAKFDTASHFLVIGVNRKPFDIMISALSNENLDPFLEMSACIIIALSILCGYFEDFDDKFTSDIEKIQAMKKYNMREIEHFQPDLLTKQSTGPLTETQRQRHLRDLEGEVQKISPLGPDGDIITTYRERLMAMQELLEDAEKQLERNGGNFPVSYREKFQEDCSQYLSMIR